MSSRFVFGGTINVDDDKPKPVSVSVSVGHEDAENSRAGLLAREDGKNTDTASPECHGAPLDLQPKYQKRAEASHEPAVHSELPRALPEREPEHRKWAEVGHEATGEGENNHGRVRNHEGGKDASAVNSEWERVQRELEDEHRKREEARRKAAEGGGKSLYEILQENKAAKQAAFEEQHRLKNQFRALDEEEIDFLDEVAAQKRAEEERLRRETEERLRAFREARRTSGTAGDAAGAASAEAGGGGEDAAEGMSSGWNAVGRKRKRTRREAVFKVGEKKTKTEYAGEGGSRTGGREGEKEQPEKVEGNEKGAARPAAAEKNQSGVAKPVMEAEKTVFALVGYGSDDDNDDE